jgi:hypothetical protein
MSYEAAAGDVVFCVAPVNFSDGSIHLPGYFYEVQEGDVEYYSLMSVRETERHLPHNYVVYALAGTIIEEDS